MLKRSFFYRSLFFLLPLFFIGCAIPSVKTIQSDILVERVSHPEIGVESSAPMGSMMLDIRVGEITDCIIPLVTKEINIEKHNSTFSIFKDREICSDGVGGNVFYPEYDNLRGKYSYKYKLVSKERSVSDDFEIFCMNGYSDYCINFSVNDLKKTFKVSPTQDNHFRRTIEYMGRNENILTFIYSEFTPDGYARHAFNRTFTMDLDRGSILRFKGAEIEVIKASNTYIRYKVIKNFI